MGRILIADDDETCRTFMSGVLQNAGFKVLEAVDGSTALGIISGGAEIDLVVTDVLMPDMDGIDLIRSLRRTSRPLKIIAVSGGGFIPAENYLESAELLGADGILEKPFTSDLFMKKVRDVLGGTSAMR